jgi:hypothetical protein
MPEGERLSDQLERWLRRRGPKTVGSLNEVFGEKSFAAVFILLLAVPALPLPTGGVTHLFELMAMLLALEMIAGRRQIWLPKRWRRMTLGPVAQRLFSEVLLGRIRWLERRSRPRLGFLLSPRMSGMVYGAVVLVLSLTAFLAPPFTGLDTLPALGVVVISAGILLEDALLALAGLLIGAAGMVLVVALGRAGFEGLRHLF